MNKKKVKYKINLKIKVILSIGMVILLFNIFIYVFDSIISPTIIAEADATMRAKALEIINTVMVKEYSKQFEYGDVIKIDKDESGNIVMIKADTLKMNKIACDVAIESQKELKNLGEIGIKIPIGYIYQNNILSNIGPKVTVLMQPIGYIETKYLSEFQSAGINQTKHKIYIQVNTKVRIIIPLKNNDIEIHNEIPIAETIIVGKIPNTSVNLDLDSAGIKLHNGQKIE